MNEVKSPKKPLVYYYAIVILVILALNFLAVPWLSQRQVKEVDYGTFMTMTENQEIGRVEVQNNQILFTNKDDTQVYKTGLMDDPDLIYRLKDSGAEFSSEIVEQMSPFLSFLLTWLLPIVFFVALGQFMLKRMTNKAGGPNSMMFGLGGSNAKVYVKSAEGIKFSDVAGEDEAKENLTEIVNYLHDPAKYQDIGASMPKGILLVGPPGTGKTTSLEQLMKHMKSKIYVIEGDIESDIDTERLRKENVTAAQINTFGACHLDAPLVHNAVHTMDFREGGILFIENVGNLVCPAELNIGENIKMLIVSVADGSDKPYKYPLAFEKADIILLNKTDLMPYLDFDEDFFMKGLRHLNKQAPVFKVSGKTGEGYKEAAAWIEEAAGKGR